MKIVLGILAILFLNQITAQETPDGWKLADSKYISLSHPANYQINHYGDTKIVMNGVEPKENDSDKFKENFGVIIKEFGDQDLTLDEFAVSTREELESSKVPPVIEKYERIQTPAGPAYQIEYSVELNGVPFYNYVRVFSKNNMGFSILYATNIEGKKNHQELVESIFNSINLKN